MSPFKTFQFYTSLKLHFNSSYDYFKYNGKIKINESQFNKKNNKKFFEVLSKKDNIPSFLLSNFSEKDYNIFDLIQNDECETNYNNWKKTKQSFSYILKNDLEKIGNLKDKKFLELLIQKQISKESLCYLIKYQNIIEQLDNELSDNVLWKELFSNPIKKYIPFIKQINKYDEIIKTHINS